MRVGGQIGRRLERVRRSVDDAALRAGREPSDVRIVLVSKYATVDQVRAAADLGHCDFGENYLQEAIVKMRAVGVSGLNWHFIGQLQSNKAAAVARAFTMIHTLSSASALRRVSAAMTTADDSRRVLLQVRLGGGTARGGVEPGAAEDMARTIAAAPGVVLDGIMGVAPPESPPRPHFARLKVLLERLRALGLANAPLGEMSAGMSGDFEEAIAEGATLVRIGRAVFET